MAKEHPDDIFHECETEEDIRQLARNYSYLNTKQKAEIATMQKALNMRERQISEQLTAIKELHLENMALNDSTGAALSTLGKTFKITLTPKQGV